MRWWLIGVACAWLACGAVRAECGGAQDCIAISSDPAVAPRHSNDGVNVPTPTINFGNQAAASASATRTILVAGVEGPAGTRATIASINISGANASDFSLAGGTCTVGTPTLLQDGAVVAQIANSCTILVRFNPGAVGVKNAQVNVTSAAIARVAPLTGTGTPSGTGPGASPATMQVPANTATTVDLAVFTSGVVTGVAIVTAPAHGTATASGTRVTYTPARDYFGPDSFTYAAFNTAGSSAAAPVTVNVSGRPDPSTDPNVVGLLDAQTRTAQRFARAQIANVQRRMETLHAGARGTSLAAVERSRGSGSDRPAQLALASPQQREREPSRADDTARDADPSGWMIGPMLAAADGRLDLAAAGGNRAGGTEAGLWMSGSIGFGRRDGDANASSLRFETDGITVGADRRINDRLVLGAAIGYGRDTTTIGSDGSDNRSDGFSVALYGSYQPTRNTFVDALIGYGSLKHRSDRFVSSFNEFAQMHRRGDQVFSSLTGGYELQRDGVLLSPYGRLDFVYDRLQDATESGAGQSALTYFEQSQTSVQAALGLRAESRHATSFGYARPRLRVEVKHEFDDLRNANVAYADLPAGPIFSVSVPGASRTAVMLGAGSDFELHNGLALGVDYSTQRWSGSDREHTLRLWLRKELDGKPLPGGAPAAAKLFADPVRVEGGYMWDDNVTRAPDADPSNQLSDHVYSIAVTKSTAIPLGSNTRLLLAGFANGEQYYTYNGLDRAGVGARAEIQYRSSAEFTAPTFGLFARSGYDEYSSALRRGWRHALGVNARQSWTDRIEAFAAYENRKREASNDVFDGRDWSARANLDYSLGSSGALYVGGEYRRGDTVTTTAPPGPGYGGYAKAVVQDDAFPDNDLFAYRIEAKTVVWTLGYNLPLGARDALDFSWRRAEATSLQPPVSGTGLGASGTPRYTVNQYSLVYLMRF